jgi:hypothetical protein
MNKPSTANLKLIPNPTELKRICKSIATLEAIICQEWESRHYSYQKSWGKNEELCEMRNGQGDQVLILFSNVGVCINGFAHESKINGWKKSGQKQGKTFFKKLLGSKKEPSAKFSQEITKELVDGLPEVFSGFIFSEPIKSIGTTFCIWQTVTDNEWKTGEVVLAKNGYIDGSRDLLQLLDGTPSSYKDWAESYYEEEFEKNELKLEPIERIYNQAVLTKQLVLSINPKIEDFEKLKSDLQEIGYHHKL